VFVLAILVLFCPREVFTPFPRARGNGCEAFLRTVDVRHPIFGMGDS
jgi:hypothetical protein